MYTCEVKVCEGEDETGGEEDDCICTVKCTVYCTKITSSTQEALTGIKYCPGTEVAQPKYFYMDYKGSSSRSWPVHYQHCAGRVRDEVSIPRVEVNDESLEQDDMEEFKKESWSTGLEEVRSMWKSNEEELEEQRLLPTGKRMGDRRVRQKFVDLY